MILEKLRTSIASSSPKTLPLNVSPAETLAGTAITRMAYDRFDELITARHNIVVRNWPLKRFCNPSAVTSRIELDLLYNAWKSGVTYFKKLTHQEMEAWESNRFSSRVELMGPPAESIPALTLPQTPAPEMTLFTDLPCQDHLGSTPTPSSDSLQNAPLAPITNLGSGPIPTSASPVLDPGIIAGMIHADPALRNVDPALIAMSIPKSNPHQVTMATNTAPIEQQLNRIPRRNGTKRRWQEVVTPLTYDTHMVKSRKQQKGTRSQDPTSSM